MRDAAVIMQQGPAAAEETGNDVDVGSICREDTDDRRVWGPAFKSRLG